MTPTWSAVVQALVGIGRERLAFHLATKYGMLDLTALEERGNEPWNEAMFHRSVF